jgi:hypothetical protein
MKLPYTNEQIESGAEYIGIEPERLRAAIEQMELEKNG